MRYQDLLTVRPAHMRQFLLTVVLGIAFSLEAGYAGTVPQPQSGPFATPLTDAALDPASFAEWVDGVVHPVSDSVVLRQTIWTRTTQPSTSHFFLYGASNHPGVRFLRVGFRAALPVGSVLVRGGGQLSVLKAGVAYPGDLADDSQWIPAQRITLEKGPAQRGQGQPGSNSRISTAEVGSDGFALWVLPAGTTTRALRFQHLAILTDSTYAGSLGGFYILTGRYTSLASQGTVLTSSNSPAARNLNDEQYDGQGWDNGPDFDSLVSTTHPEWILLSWPTAVPLRGLAALLAGFNAAGVQVFEGPVDEPLLDASESDWHSISSPWALRNQYPLNLGVDWLDFGRLIKTRAVRIYLTQATNEDRHPHLAGKTKGGNRVWLDELMAITPLDVSDLQSALLPAAPELPHPPIPIRFTLASPGNVSLVIDDAQGNRVRNVVSDTWFPTGLNTVWWDGCDDLGRDRDAADHGAYDIPAHFVSAGSYRVRGIVHQAIELRYEFSIYNGGSPPWETADGTGGWLTNHTPASSALFIPAEKAPGGKPLVYLGSWISEGGSALAWVDLDGRKLGGRGWIGGTWTGAQFLARDQGPQANPEIYAYAASSWGDKNAKGDALRKAVIRLTGLGVHGDKPILASTFDLGEQPTDPSATFELWKRQIGGLAVYNNIALLSLNLLNQLLVVDTVHGTTVGSIPIEKPRGLAFDPQGNLLVISGKRLLEIRLPKDSFAAVASANPEKLPSAEVLVDSGLDAPAGIAIDSDGTIAISDGGDSNQVKIYSAAGKFVRAIGHAGPLQVGTYDPLHMNNPHGIAIDSNHHLWVTEEDFQPKRVSLWNLYGSMIKAFYGPSEYGGGGSLDPQDKTRFYYHAMEFKLDWDTGSYSLSSILNRPGKSDLVLPRYATPETVTYSHGHRYFDNTYLANTITGNSIAFIYLDTGGTIHPVAALGRANDWSVLKDPAFQYMLPPNVNLGGYQSRDQVLFTWSDINNNGKVDAEEVTFVPATSGFVTVMPDLALVDAFVDGKTVRYAPAKFTSAGVPVYDIHGGQVVAQGAQIPSGDGGGQAIYSPSALVLTTAPAPFSRDGVAGIDGEGHRWSYPSLWPGLHNGHSSPLPDFAGELEATTRLLGGFIHPPGSNAGSMWGINSNNGELYLFTADGLFITQLFQDARLGKPWTMPKAERNMLVNGLTLHAENFFPSLTQTADGKVYVLDGSNMDIIRVDGLGSVQRIPDFGIDVTQSELENAHSYLKHAEVSRHDQFGEKVLTVTIHPAAFSSTDQLGDALHTMRSADWATIDNRTTTLGFGNLPESTKAAITVSGDRLYAAFRTHEPSLLLNSGAIPNAPFKTGGALDLLIGTDPGANPKRETPAAGDIRLLVYRDHGKTRATLYRAVVPGTRQPVSFSSPLRTITFDQVIDVSDQVNFQSLNGGDVGGYIFSIPLSILGLNPVAGEKVKADIGILRGDGTQTIQRVYWSNKATGIVSDVPSEAEFTPRLWGEWIFKLAP